MVQSVIKLILKWSTESTFFSLSQSLLFKNLGKKLKEIIVNNNDNNMKINSTETSIIPCFKE